MPVMSSEEFFNHLTTHGLGRLLGLDVGRKRIGLALSDAGRLIASPHSVILRTPFESTAQLLLTLIHEQEVCGLVVGLPLNLNGSASTLSQSVRHFVYNFLQVKEMPVMMWDERYSTLAAERVLLSADLSRAKRHTVIDKVAASVILQNALDFLSE